VQRLAVFNVNPVAKEASLEETHHASEIERIKKVFQRFDDEGVWKTVCQAIVSRYRNALRISIIRRAFPMLSLRSFWDQKAEYVHKQWGGWTHDFEVIADCVRTINAHSVLDVGCGDGRLFPLYYESGLRFCGCDLSRAALRLARSRYPAADLRRMAAEDISLSSLGQTFDLAVSTRVLQHVRPAAIDRAVRGICGVASFVYINEIAIEDVPDGSDYLFGHAYMALFQNAGFKPVSSGWIQPGALAPRQWFLFKKAT
jgi:2-polyprenyl-3-methyl-5-hydroxy-6-metoxy-1,4-benzoquinol methylase